MATQGTKTEDVMELVDNDDGTYTVYENGGAEAQQRRQAVDDDNDDDDNNDDDDRAAAADADADDDDQPQADASVKRGGAQDDDEEEPDPEDQSQEAKRIRRRNERKNRKEAQRARVNNLEHELAVRDNIIADLSARVNNVEQRGSQVDMAQLDQEIQRVGQAETYFKRVIAEATKKQDGEAVANATEKLLEVKVRGQQLSAFKQQAVQTATQRGAAPLNPAVQAHGEAWLRRNKWYNPQSHDERALLVRSIDAALLKEGLNPATPTYWTELDKKLRKYNITPNKSRGNNVYNGGDDDGDATQQQQRSASAGSRSAGDTRSTVAGGRSSRGAQGAAGGGSFKLSAQRVQAIKDAGMWEDPKTRAEAITEYRKWDRQNSGR